jgi:hypothetical protein
MRGFILFFLLFIPAGNFFAQVATDYRSVGTGNWNAVGTWQTYNGTGWVAAGVTPTAANANVITITAGNIVTINLVLSIDQVVVNGKLRTGTTQALTIANGAGVDLVINGTFVDSLTTAVITWNGTWQFGAAGTLLKVSGSSSNNWQSSYSGGAATMPATANWIVRKINGQNPVLSTVGAFYPNLTIENKHATVTNYFGATFSGSTGFATVLGNLDIGGTGTNAVTVINTNTNASSMLVYGNVTLRSGSSYGNFGTGIEIRGNLTVSGTFDYDINDGRKIIFSGTNNQTISGTGYFAVYDWTLNKSSGTVTLNRAVTVDNVLTMTGGILYTTTLNILSIPGYGSISGGSNTSFVSGPVQYLGVAAFTFPVGKGSDYQPLSIGANTGSPGIFWREAFSNSCSNACTLPYTGSNGTWTSVSTGTNDPESNLWFVSGAECGNPTGGCGAGCATFDPSLHVGPDDGFVLDGGAHYDAGGLCGGFFSVCVTSDIRAESPTINCTGYSGITLSFVYMENGEGLLDNATAWYYDGGSWSQLVDLPKTSLCGVQGQWTNYSIALPASANNNPSVKIGFRWVNNDDGSGTDPSFAVDDISLGTVSQAFTAEYFYANPQATYNNNLAPTLTSISACEYWTLDRSPIASTAAATVRLTWDGNSCPAIPQTADTRVAHFDGTTWQDEGNGGNTGSAAGGTVVSSGQVTSFSPFTIGLIPTVPLPVELVNFSGYCNGDEIQLSWQTASETNNQYFSLERSTDGIHFTTIARVEGAGSSTQLQQYVFADKPDNDAKLIYYRLSQTDFNGQLKVYSPIAVDASACNTDGQLTIDALLPGESGLVLTYSGAKGVVDCEVYAANGMLVYSAESGEGNLNIPVAGLSEGLYFVRLSDGFSTVSRNFFH